MEEKKKKIALFRGGFNPVHNGHINVVKEVLKAELVDEVWIVPWIKYQFDKELVKDEWRVDMINLAFEGIDNVKVCREELDFPGMSDPYSTLNRLNKKYNSINEFVWLGGSDLFYDAIKWYRHLEVFKMIDFIIFERKGYPIKEVEGMNVRKIFSINVSGISSKQIRLRVYEGQSIMDLVPRKVEDYIRRRFLYTKVYLP